MASGRCSHAPKPLEAVSGGFQQLLEVVSDGVEQFRAVSGAMRLFQAFSRFARRLLKEPEGARNFPWSRVPEL
eukprot:7432955-Alexandrium_andersonii.AAC.1